LLKQQSSGKIRSSDFRSIRLFAELRSNFAKTIINKDNMRTIHLVSHTHWDREWYLTFQQFRLKLVRLVDHLLDILEHDSSYRHFMLDGQTIVLEDYLQIRPEREDDLRKYIQNGRILIGPWYILPDEFLVSPEASIRNLLEGERTSKFLARR
jgi:alpha-mannosidase